MASREEIKEGIDTSIQFVITTAYLAGKTGESLDEAKEKCTTYLKEALHSQGVVIKVDRELPTYWMGEAMPYGMRNMMIEAGCGFFEPLIEEKG